MSSCQHKDLYFGDHNQLVEIGIHWETGIIPPQKGMRADFYTRTVSSPEVGTEDFPSPLSGTLHMQPLASYDIVCYNYLGSEVNKIRNNRDPDQIQVYTSEHSRASYTKAFPDEHLITMPDDFYMSRIVNYQVDAPWLIDFYPTNRVLTYTFEIKNVRGAGYLTSLAGACSGLSASYYIGREEVGNDISTVVFEADKDKANNKITGSFRTFGRVKDTSVRNKLTMEIRYPSGNPENGYLIKTWDITEQMSNGTQHIVLDWDIDIIPTVTGGYGFEVTVLPWDEVWIPLEL